MEGMVHIWFSYLGAVMGVVIPMTHGFKELQLGYRSRLAVSALLLRPNHLALGWR